MIESGLFKKNEVRDAIRFIRQTTDFKPRIALILGSGLSGFGERVDAIAQFRSFDIPHYPLSSVQGHMGKLIFGYLHADKAHVSPLLVFQGRTHYYEIASLERVIFPIIVARRLGIKKIIITNAAGGINACFHAGDLMLIEDILSLAFIRLPFLQDNFHLSALDDGNYFDTTVKRTAFYCASQLNIRLQRGTYGWLKGPSYETPAEIHMLKRIGVDAVGMSTVPEIYAAKRLGMNIIGLSLISNLAAGISPMKLSHSDVTRTGTKVTKRISEFMEHLVLSIGHTYR